jgi:AcrR family transcriptional regulator
MSIPVREPATSWPSLGPAAKRERLLRAAAEVFARDGFDASMPSVAAAAGAGVASVYRQFESKQELLAALVERRLEQVTAGAKAAMDQGGTRWCALTNLLTNLVELQSCDEFLGEAMQRVDGHPAVRSARKRAYAALERLLDDARAEGRLRADASILDLRLLFAATRAARHLEPDLQRRTLELLVDGLDTAQSGSACWTSPPSTK